MEDRQHLDEMAEYHAFQIMAYQLRLDNMLNLEDFSKFIRSDEKLARIFLGTIRASKDRYNESSMRKILEIEIKNYPINWFKKPSEDREDVIEMMRIIDECSTDNDDFLSNT